MAHFRGASFGKRDRVEPAVALAAEAQGVGGPGSPEKASKMRRELLRIVLWLLIACVGCSDPSGPSEQYPDAIRSLVDSSPFPAKQEVHAESLPPGGDFIWLFTLSYGQANDCPSGCFYSGAWGLLHGDKIAWFEVNDYDGNEFPWLALYDLGPEDSVLFQPAVYRALEAIDSSFYRYSFLHRVAQAEDIGRAPLAHALYSLYSFGDGQLARLLVANQVVRADRDLLLALAGLPSNGEYDDVKQEALELLGLSGGGSRALAADERGTVPGEARSHGIRGRTRG